MRPIISYYGGKQRIASKVVKLIPKHSVYCEPFCGGCAVLFKKPWPNVTNNSHYIEIINDSSELLINMYRVFQTRFDEIEHLLIHTLFSESEHKKSRDILKGEIEADDLWKAWAYYVNINQGFSCKLFSGWGRGIFGMNLGAVWSSKLSRLNQYKERMSSVIIACTDALKCIKQYDSPQTFFYCDPPYVDSNQGHYDGYSKDDFQNLIKILANIQGSFLLSTYQVDGIETPKEWEIFNIEATCTASCKGRVGNDKSKVGSTKNVKRTELVYRKFSIEPRAEIKKMYASGNFDCFIPHPWEEFRLF